MPFTLAHAAAALPLRRLKLVWSAVVIGTFAPDFGLFLGLADRQRDSHHFPQVLTFVLPMALLVLWLFHQLLKRPLVELLPEGFRIRLLPHMGRFQFGGVRRFALILLSICVGIATHLVWDSFTHRYSWVVENFDWLRKSESLWILGERHVVPYFGLLQYASSVLGCVALALWITHWYRSTSPVSVLKTAAFAPRWRAIIATVMLTVPWSVALWLAAQRGHESEDFLHVRTFANYLVLLPGSLLAIELLVFGIVTTQLLRLRQENS